MTHPTPNTQAEPTKLTTADLYKRLCDLRDEARSVDTVLGRPALLAHKLTELCSEIGKLRVVDLATPPAPPASDVAGFVDATRKYLDCLMPPCPGRQHLHTMLDTITTALAQPKQPDHFPDVGNMVAMERALKVIYTWAGVPGALVPEQVRATAGKALGMAPQGGPAHG